MESLGVVFAMLIAIVTSGVIVRVLPWSISLPLLLKSSSHLHPALSPFDEQRQRAIQKAKYSASDQDTLAQIDYAIERKICLAIIQSARQSIYKQARDRKISDEVAKEIVKQLDYDEVRFN